MEDLLKAEGLLNNMDVPDSRRNLMSTVNVLWLLRNLGVRNSDHPNFEEVVDWLRQNV